MISDRIPHATNLAERVRAGDATLGVFINLGSPLATEVCALAGFDWLLVDLEHGAGGEEALLGQIHAASTHGVSIVARVESADRIRSGRVLDLGAHGVMLPRVESAEGATQAVSNLRYPPTGHRGVATYNRSRQFGQDTRPLAQVDASILALVQIETPPALEVVEEIAEQSGADVLFIGPSDLSVSMGLSGQLEADAFQAALHRVIRAADSAGVAAGILASDVGAAKRYLEMGFRFVAVSSDATMLSRSAIDTSTALAQARDQAQLRRDHTRSRTTHLVGGSTSTETVGGSR